MRAGVVGCRHQQGQALALLLPQSLHLLPHLTRCRRATISFTSVPCSSPLRSTARSTCNQHDASEHRGQRQKHGRQHLRTGATASPAKQPTHL